MTTLFCPGLQSNTADRLEEIREKSTEKLPACDGCFQTCGALGYEGQARTWELQKTRFTEKAYGSCIGLGLLSRIQRTASALFSIPFNSLTFVGCTGTSALLFAGGTVCLPVSVYAWCRDNSHAFFCCEVGCHTAQVAGLSLAGVVKETVCLPANILAPEVVDLLGQQQINLTLNETGLRVVESLSMARD